MQKQQLITIIKELSAARPVFHAEADFQLELGLLLAKKGHNVRLEKSFKRIGMYPKIELDIELDNSIAIELKYKTQLFNATIGDEDFELKLHGAANLGRFDVLDDARRVSLLTKAPTTKIKKGFTVFLTNDIYYWLYDAAGSMSEEFSLLEGRNFNVGESLNWVGNSFNPNSLSKKRMSPYAPIATEFNETIAWHDYSNFEKKPNGLFRFFVLEVNN
jgi:hypothetical protein